MLSGFRFDLLAKSGYAARGIVFLLVGGLALASGVTGSQPETKSAIATLLSQPLGRVWVGAIGLGLLGFVCWRLAQSIADTDDHGRSSKGLIIRSALIGSAFTYLGLAGYALAHSLGRGSGGEGSGEQDLAQWIMSQPFGSYLTIAVGIGFVIGGAVTAIKGLTRKFQRYLRIPDQNTIALWICVYGLVARGIVFAIIGILFITAGMHADPRQAGNMADALQWLRQMPFGPSLYVTVALGLGAFGIYNLIEARYRIIRSPSVRVAMRLVDNAMPGR